MNNYRNGSGVIFVVLSFSFVFFPAVSVHGTLTKTATHCFQIFILQKARSRLHGTPRTEGPLGRLVERFSKMISQNQRRFQLLLGSPDSERSEREEARGCPTEKSRTSNFLVAV